jgi:predicted MFS family arabinose efflux permease
MAARDPNAPAQSPSPAETPASAPTASAPTASAPTASAPTTTATPPAKSTATIAPAMTSKQRGVLVLLALLQFAVMIDFMILAPLGALMMPALRIAPDQFALLVSAYALAAGVSGVVAAGFIDRFDRKKLLLFFFGGFLVGTLLCGLATTYPVLLAARVIAGIFGGVIASLNMAIAADLFPPEQHGRVMGTLQTSFGAAQIAGLPAGIAIANHLHHQAPFLVIAGLGVVVFVAVAIAIPPVTAPLTRAAGAPLANPFAHVIATARKPVHLRAFATTLMLAAGFMLHPQLSAFFVHNLGVTADALPVVYRVAGVCTVVVGPLAGKLADTLGKFPLFALGTAGAALMFVALAALSGPTALWVVVAVNAGLFAANTARAVSAGALVMSVPAPAERGAFLSVNTALQQMAGGVAAYGGGVLVGGNPDGSLANFNVVAAVIAGVVVVGVVPVAVIARATRA